VKAEQPSAEAAGQASTRLPGPPRISFALAVGVTGHRLDTILADALPHIERRLAEVLGRC